MVSEALRELGVLIGVFAILDRLIADSITLLWSLTAIGVSALCFTAGGFLERRRPMHSFLQDYGSLLIGVGVCAALFLTGMVSIWREEARRAKAISSGSGTEHRQGAAPVRH